MLMGNYKVVIRQWGNSQGIRIPKAILDLMGLYDNDELLLSVEDDKIILQKPHKQIKPYPSLEERFANFQGDHSASEYDTHVTTGDEI